MPNSLRAKNMLRSLFRTSLSGESLWWSDTLGWVERHLADGYTDEERALRRKLPVDVLDDGAIVCGVEWWSPILTRGRYRLDD